MRIITIALLCCSYCFAQGNDAALIQKVRVDFWESFRAKDVDKLRNIMADDYYEPNSTRVATKADVLGAAPKVDMTDFALDQFKVIWLGKDSAIVSYNVRQHWTMNGQAGPPHVRASTALQKRKGQWVVVFHQETVAE